MEIDLSMIVAMTMPNRIIGNKGKLPWQKLPSDLARFKKITTGTGVMVMGRGTYASILERNGKPLVGRKHIVLTRKTNLYSIYDSVQFVRSLEEACIEIIKNGGQACIIGGGEIYKLFLPLPQVRRLFVTKVYAPNLTGDVYFPEITTEMGWKLFSNNSLIERKDPRDEYSTSFELYMRPNPLV